MNRRSSIPIRLLALALFASAPLAADWKDDIGHTRLLQTFGSEVPDAVALGLTQVEAPTVKDDPVNYYLPDTANPAFADKTIANLSLGTGISTHATNVGLPFYGIGSSLLPFTPTIDAYNANHWINDGFLRTGTINVPRTETRRVQNHSWISIYERTETQTETVISNYVAGLNRRLDFAINRDGFLSAVGMNNDASTTLPDLLGQTYHTLSVGLVNGAHSAGLTTHDGAGRMKPDLVAFNGYTSFATPQVAGAAGLLSEKLRATPLSPALNTADYPRLTKALLLSGATKEPLPSWTRASAATPYDAIYGAGALNILTSYRILESGRFDFSSSNTVPSTGWSHASVSSSGSPSNVTRTYFFDVDANSASAPFSVALIWHRVVDNSLASTLANLDLELYSVSSGTLDLESLVDSSVSTVDNVEHIYRTNLSPGRYALRVRGTAGATTTYALAWRSTPTVTIAATAPVARELDGAQGQFTVTRTGPVTTPLLVPLQIGGSAVSGSHYTALPAHVLIPAGASTVTLQVTPIADDLAQGDRPVTVTLATDYSLSAGASASASVTIEDKPYSTWLHARFTAPQLADPLVSGDSADPDGDGVLNLLEYAFGLEPLSADTPASAADRLPASGLDAENHLTLAYFHAADRPDLVFAVEWSDDLVAPWQTGPTFTEEISREPLAGGERVTVRSLAPSTPDVAPRQFLRLRVTRQ